MATWSIRYPAGSPFYGPLPGGTTPWSARCLSIDEFLRLAIPLADAVGAAHQKSVLVQSSVLKDTPRSVTDMNRALPPTDRAMRRRGQDTLARRA